MVVTLRGVEALVSKLNSLQQNQIPFATSRAVNALAYEVQRDTINRLLPSKFNLRNDWWRPGRKTGVNFFKSHKRQKPIKAIVNTLAPFMELQETGGEKQPRPGHAFIPIPTYNAQPDKKQMIRPNRRFKALVTGGKGGRRTLAHKGNVWLETLRQKGPRVAVRLLDDARLPIATMYVGKTSVTIKPRFGFRENAGKIVERNFHTIFEREMAQAIATAK